jgi:hypothetical protein
LEQRRVAELDRAFQQALGPMGLGSRATAVAALALAKIQTLRVALFGDMAQPRARLTRYRWPDSRREPAPQLSLTTAS